ncbi:Hypothetical protein A7982_11620 [Minicystis rosea]|nr:Hypothetical protein A7982_11620 [Minicystis rosea]
MRAAKTFTSIDPLPEIDDYLMQFPAFFSTCGIAAKQTKATASKKATAKLAALGAELAAPGK